ncbi:hypothetical protein C478_14767 [Natrinema thermotolerans DSM 11552]|nr:hypothetical protein C478_14767 [Natrinema thermotolerans DSM 11552]
MTDINRRKLLKSVGIAAGAGVAGIGNVQASSGDVSTTDAETALDRDVSRTALKTAGVDPDSIAIEDATETQVRTERWVQVPIEGDAEHFAYNDEADVAEIKTGENTLVRARRDDGEIRVENLVLGDAVTTEALETLQASDDWTEALENGEVATVDTADAAAHRDLESGVSRVFVSATLESGADTLLIAEIDGAELGSVYSLAGQSDGITTQESAIDCWVNCITWGTFCATPCQVCVADPTRVSCAPCAVCIGGTAAGCAAKCGIEQFW